MKTAFALLSVLSVFSACASEDCDETQTECDKIAADIRQGAALRGIPSQGICSSSNARTQRDFGSACAKLRDCNDRVAECRD